MFLEFSFYICFLLSSIFLLTRYIVRERKPLSFDSPILDKMFYGVTYGIIGASMIYIHQALHGIGSTDPRQIAILLPLFYGGWIPSLISTLVIFGMRAFVLSDGAKLLLLAFSMICTLGIAQWIMWSKIERSKQWYILTIVTTIEIYLFLWFREQPSSLFDTNLLQFVFSFMVGSIFVFHFEESLRLSFFTMEELKQSKRDLEEAESNYRLIAEHSSDLIVVLDVNHVSLYISPSYQSIFGIDPKSFVGTVAGNYVHPEDRRTLEHSWEQAVSEKKPSHGIYRYRHADGHWIWLESLYVPVVKANGEIEKVVVTSRDITERKQTEELIRNTEKLSIVGELAAGIAHEIRNPLTTLMGFTQMMKNDPSISQTHFLNIMYDELNRIDIITNELLYLAKPQVQEIKEISLKTLLYQLHTLLTPQALLQNINLSIEVEESLPLIEGIENRLKQVCINLVKNGMDAMPTGGEITIQAKREDEKSLLLLVKDEGIGIPEDRIEKLGQPFYSLKEKGTGLGLTVCKKIIQEHNGIMKFYSKVGVGTTVEVQLPLKILE